MTSSRLPTVVAKVRHLCAACLEDPETVARFAADGFADWEGLFAKTVAAQAS